MKRVLLALLFLLAGAGIADAQIASEIANGGGTSGAITAGVGSGTAGRVPQFASATSVVDSKMLTSGTNSGTWTLYDSTATSGRTMFEIREGESDVNSGNYLLRFVSWGGSLRGGIVAGINEINVRADRYDDVQNNNFSLVAGNGLYMIDTLGIRWANGSYYNTAHTGLMATAGVLKVSDGSTGFGSARAAAFGVETANGAISNVQTSSEEITLSLLGTNSDSSANLLPANSIILSVTAYVTTLITGATDWNLTDTASANRFMVANATLAVGTTGIGLRHLQGSVATDALGPIQTTADKIRIVTTGTPTAGKVRVTVTYLSLTPPTS